MDFRLSPWASQVSPWSHRPNRAWDTMAGVCITSAWETQRHCPGQEIPEKCQALCEFQVPSGWLIILDHLLEKFLICVPSLIYWFGFNIYKTDVNCDWTEVLKVIGQTIMLLASVRWSTGWHLFKRSFLLAHFWNIVYVYTKHFEPDFTGLSFKMIHT